MSQSSVFSTVVTTIACAFLVSSSPALGSTIFVPADHPTIQAAIDTAVSGDEIVAMPGTYNELIDFSGKAIALRSSDGAAATTIDGSTLDGSVVQCINGEGPGTVLRGFTITGGIGTLVASIRLGGGIYTDRSSPTIEECVFIGNTARNGGAMANYGGDRPLVLNCWIGGNTAVQGGGVFNFSSSPTVVNCVFTGNHATTISGGMDNSSSSNPTVVNCTFSRNTSDGPGGGMTTGAGTSSSLRVENCIFWQNADSGGMDESAQIHVGENLPTVRFSCIQGLVAGGAFDSGSNTENIGDDPAFVDADGADNFPGTLEDDLRLLAGSPCIDAGDNAAVPAGVTTDLSGGARIANGIVDRGAYERVADETPPSIRCPADLVAECDGPGGTPVLFSVTAADTSDPSPLVVCDPPSGSLFPKGDTVVVCRATDQSGNFAECTFTVRVDDTTAPGIACPQDIRTGCDPTDPAAGGAVVKYSLPVATDACDADPSVVCEPASGTVFALRTTEVVCTATDACGNRSECRFTVEVVDEEAPSLSCVEDLTVECTSPDGAPVKYSAPEVTNECSDTPDIEKRCYDANGDEIPCLPSGSVFPPGRTRVCFTATDPSGNVAECCFDITVVDTTPPEITCPDDLVAECESPDGAIVEFPVFVADTCDPEPQVSCDPPSGSLFPIGETLVVCTATDRDGNAAECRFVVSVVDTTAPVIDCPEGITVEPNVDGGYVGPIGEAVATDLCSEVRIENDAPAVFPIGPTTVTWSAVDEAGNPESCTQAVEVLPGTFAFRIDVLSPEAEPHGSTEDTTDWTAGVAVGQAVARVEIGVVLESRFVPSVSGVEGWSLAVDTGECFSLLSATTAGTAAADENDDPPGFRRGGFEFTEIVDPGHPNNSGRRGVVSAVVLGQIEPVVLPPAGDFLVLRIAGDMDASALRDIGDRTAPPCVVRPLTSPPWLTGSGQRVETLVIVETRGRRPSGRGVALTLEGVERLFVRGDVDQNGVIDLSDGVSLLRHLFQEGFPEPPCSDAADSNDNGILDISDAVAVLNWLFLGGVKPAPPSPSGAGYLSSDCGPDPTADDISCASSFCAS